MAVALLAVALIALGWLARNDVKGFARFRTITDTRVRQRLFLRWAATGCALFLVMPLAGLALLGRLDALWSFPAEFEPAALSDDLDRVGTDLFLIGSLAVGLLIGWLLNKLIRRKPRPPRPLAAILPRNAAEARRVALIAVNAGIAEEIFCRVYLPLLLVLVGLGAPTAFVASCVIFGLLHRYQGWVGILVTAYLGGMFTLSYLLTRGLEVPMFFHLAINIGSLIVRPALRGWEGTKGSDDAD